LALRAVKDIDLLRIGEEPVAASDEKTVGGGPGDAQPPVMAVMMLRC
jgi:hypothetical protein